MFTLRFTTGPPDQQHQHFFYERTEDDDHHGHAEKLGAITISLKSSSRHEKRSDHPAGPCRRQRMKQGKGSWILANHPLELLKNAPNGISLFRFFFLRLRLIFFGGPT